MTEKDEGRAEARATVARLVARFGQDEGRKRARQILRREIRESRNADPDDGFLQGYIAELSEALA